MNKGRYIFIVCSVLCCAVFLFILSNIVEEVTREDKIIINKYVVRLDDFTAERNLFELYL